MNPAPALAAAIDPPASVTAVAGRRAIAVTWTPAANQSPPAARYRASAGDKSCDLIGPSFPGTLTCTISDLAANTPYTVSVVACPNVSLNDPTDCSAPRTAASAVTAGPPAAPAAPTVVFQGDPNTVRLSWPTPEPGAGIASYRITSSDPGLTGDCAALVPFGTNTCDFTGLANDAAYTFRVTAIGVTNGSITTGTSPAGAASAPKVAGPPHQPAKPTVTRESDTAVRVSFAKPAGGQALAGYTVSGTASGAAPAGCTAQPNETDCLVTGLDPTKSYTFKVVAGGENTAAGVSPESVASDPIITGLPAVPATPMVELGAQAGEVVVVWDAPDLSTSGAPTSYTVTSEPTDGGSPLTGCTDLAGTATSCQFSGLQDGMKYRFRVTATNAAGAETSAWSDEVVSELPATPGTPQVELGDEPGKVLLDWPAASSGGPVVFYSVTAVPTDGTNEGVKAAGCGFNLATPTCVITGLTTTTSYKFTVTAVGDLGSVESAESAPIVPDQPGAPTSAAVALTGNPGEATVSWAAPADGGEVEAYTVTATPAGGSAITSGCANLASSATDCTFAGLDTTKTHTFSVEAINAAGDATAPATATVPDIPSAPVTPLAAVGGSPGSVVVTWTAPAQGDAERYLVEATSSDTGASLPPSPCVDAAAALTCTISGLTPEKPYEFTVRAQNLLGGTSAAATDPIVPDKPGAPEDVTVTVTAAGEATVAWAAPATGGPVETYEVTATSPDAGNLPGESPCVVATDPPAPLSCDFTGMEPDKAYQFTVRAVNDIDGTDAALTAEVVPGAPGAPQNVEAVLGDAPGKVTVNWDAPTGAAATTYTVSSDTATQGAAEPGCTANAPSTSCDIAGLDPTASYAFTVNAKNTVDPAGTDSAPTTPELVPDVPGEPTAVDVALTAATPGSVDVTWGVPADGGVLTEYTVTPASATTGAFVPPACTKASGDTRTCTFADLTQTATYSFTVTARNNAGESEPVTVSSIVPSVPGEPTNLVVTLTATPGEATLTWEPPVAGGAAVVDYTASASSAANGSATPTPCANVSPAGSLTCTLTGMTTTAAYTFKVRATNASGDTDATTPAIVPNLAGAPTEVAVALGTPGKATVTWAAPTDTDRGPALTYTVTPASTDLTAVVPSVCTKTSDEPMSCQFDNLTLTAPYTFVVRAENPSGGTDAAETAAVKPNKPGAPTSVTAERGDAAGKAVITWVEPTDLGAVDSYLVTATPAGGGAATTCTKVAADPTTCTLTGLDETEEYSFTVQAINLAGDSVTPAAETFIPNVPDAPAGVTVTLSATPGTATVSWDAATTGATVNSYRVTVASPDGGIVPAVCDRIPSNRSCVFSGLTTTASYTFTVRAINEAGGADAPTTAAIVPNRPNATAAPTATVVDGGTARVTWTAPVTGGQVMGYQVNAYKVSDPDVAITATACTGLDAAARTCDFDGLLESESYTFVVTATGPGGDAASERSAAVTTAGPGAPDQPDVALAGPGAVRVTWTAPTEGGPVTGYSVESNPSLSAPARCTNVKTFTCVFDRLVSGTAYTFTVLAHGSADRSAESVASSSVIAGPPAVPGRPTVAPTDDAGQVRVTWTAPAVDGGEIIGYEVESTTGGYGCTTGNTTCLVEGLVPGDSYTFRVRATGAAGAGNSAYSAASTAITPGAPAAPTDVVVTAGNRQISVAWTQPEGPSTRVTGYRAETSPGGFHCETGSVADTECLITGLTNLTSYRVTVVATGGDGNSPASEPSRAVRPNAGVPGSPTGVQAAVGNGSATVTWAAPAVIGDGISRYVVTAAREGDTQTCLTPNGATLRCVLEGLTNGQAYTVTVVAVGRAASGYSAPSAPVTVVAKQPPGTPVTVSATGGVKTMTVRWASGGAGDGLAGFTATATPTGGGTPYTCSGTATATSCSISTVTPGPYSVSVVANSTTSGLRSAASAPVTTTVLLAAAPTLGSLPTTTNVLSVTGTPKPGGTVAVSGDGFAPYTSISFGVYTTATGLTRVTTVVTTDGTGAFSQDITIPAAVTIGARTLVAAGLPPTGTTLRYAKAAITVTAS